MSPPDTATARAPASVGNVGVGFDILGLAFGALEDRVTARRLSEKGVRLDAVSGCVDVLPGEADRNTALRGARALLDEAGAEFGVELSVQKGVPLSAGLGGSAASAVAAVVAVNALLDSPLDHDALFPFALEGERASSDPPPPDNVAACLMGGLVLTRPGTARPVTRLPLPSGLVCVVTHPDARLDTRDGRAALKPDAPLSTVIAHTGNLASFLAGCAADDHGLIAEGLRDVLVEPQRAGMVPGFANASAAAMEAGALGCSLSGSGPSIFAWCAAPAADDVAAAMVHGFGQGGVSASAYRAPLCSAGAEVISA